MNAFGSNPGSLKAKVHIPDSYRPGAPLVVVLHGCTQSPEGYDLGTGWSRLADEQGFALLFPQQQRANNPNLCFNWFNPDDARRGSGEALSIRQMITAMQAAHKIDPGRVFVTGLSAGGAMAAVMLATYPDVFSGGAVVAGLPFGAAATIPEAFDRMRGHAIPPPSVLADAVRSASNHKGPWPTLSVWHGTADATVDHSNATALVEQWKRLHGTVAEPTEDVIGGYPHRSWRNRENRVVLEEYEVTGMGHGTPLDTGRSGTMEHAGPFLLEAGISSTRRIAAFWGIARSPPRTTAARPALPSSAQRAEQPQSSVGASAPVSSVQATIEKALRTAGLMR